jgi:DNA-binding NarL/FixJ family response regulator
LRVLVVIEDEPGMRLLIHETLSEDEQLEIEGEVETLEEALEEVRKRPPDLIILDHYLTGKTMGLEGAPRLKEIAPEAKIVLFSGHDLSVEVSREPAVDAFLHKKNLDQLLPLVHELLGI